jgi:hypothetical protein
MLGGNSGTISVEKLSRGIYFLKLETETNSYIKKLAHNSVLSYLLWRSRFVTSSFQ